MVNERWQLSFDECFVFRCACLGVGTLRRLDKSEAELCEQAYRECVKIYGEDKYKLLADAGSEG